MDINKAISSAVKTGKVTLGVKSTLETAKTGKAKLIILASNCPENSYEEILHYTKIAKIPVHIYDGSSLDLGTTCRKPFTVSAMAIKEPGDSEILKLTETSYGK